jgi:soluble lytic murein transglycosylase-like protein
MKRIVSLALLVGATCLACQKDPAQPPPQTASVARSTSIRWLPSSVRRFSPLIDEAASRHGVDANLVAVMILVESGGDPIATSPAGALGLMQLMPETAQDIARERGMPAHVDARLYDPAYNIDLGTYYIAKQIRRFWTGDPMETVARAAGAYNGGPGRMSRHLDRGEPLPGETLRYQQWIGGMWRDRYMSSSPAFNAWWQQGGERKVAKANGPIVVF